jgi:HK97 family phage major capsid protein
MTAYNQIIARSGGSDALVPEPLSASIIEELPKQSAALRLMRKTQLSTKTERMPVLDVLPNAFFVGTGQDTGLKQTTDMAWKNVVLVVEEIAVIVPIPEAYMADTDVPIWSEVQPRLAEAVGALIDGAVFWGINRPSTWGMDIYTSATAAGNYVKDGFLDGAGTEPADDFGQSVTALGDLMAQTGYTMNGFAARPGMNWRLLGIRSAQGIPIYQPDMGDGTAGQLYGYSLGMVDNGSWQASKAQAIGGDWSKAIIGLRQDMTFKMFSEGVISDNNGAVILNLMQQDAVAMRLTMRMAYAVANPVTIMQPSESIDGAPGTTMRFPFGYVAS